MLSGVTRDVKGVLLVTGARLNRAANRRRWPSDRGHCEADVRARLLGQTCAGRIGRADGAGWAESGRRPVRDLPTAARLASARVADLAVGLRGLVAAQQTRRARLLARAAVAVQRAPLDGPVDRAHERAVLRVGGLRIAGGHGGCQAAEVGPDRRGVAPVL
jgi:hypothetical protein